MDIPCFWVIEYLEDRKLPTHFLEELVWVIEKLEEFQARIPNELLTRLSDSDSSYARERLALRHLEDLFGVPQCKTIDPNSKFHVWERAQDVLSHVDHELTASSSRKFTIESLKWDVHQFIFQKRAFLPKCALEQVKEAIFSVRHSPLRKMNGLDIERHEENMHEVVPSEAIERGHENNTVVVSPTPRLNLAQLAPENGDHSLQANILNSTRSDMKNRKQVVVEENGICFHGARSCGSNTEKEAHSKNETPGMNFTLSKRKRKRKSTEFTREQVDSVDGDENRLTAKKPKCGQFESVAHNTYPLLVSELLEEPLDNSHLRISNEETIGGAKEMSQGSQTACRSSIRCYRGDQLLISCANNCPAVVHESCYCPFCLFSQFSADYTETTKGGVEKFAVGDHNNIRWRKMLEFGRNVFLAVMRQISRTRGEEWRWQKKVNVKVIPEIE